MCFYSMYCVFPFILLTYLLVGSHSMARSSPALLSQQSPSLSRRMLRTNPNIAFPISSAPTRSKKILPDQKVSSIDSNAFHKSNKHASSRHSDQPAILTEEAPDFRGKTPAITAPHIQFADTCVSTPGFRKCTEWPAS